MYLKEHEKQNIITLISHLGQLNTILENLELCLTDLENPVEGHEDDVEKF